MPKAPLSRANRSCRFWKKWLSPNQKPNELKRLPFDLVIANPSQIKGIRKQPTRTTRKPSTTTVGEGGAFLGAPPNEPVDALEPVIRALSGTPRRAPATTVRRSPRR